MPRARLPLFLAGAGVAAVVLSLAGCSRTAKNQSDQAQAATPTGPIAVKPGWYKTPESLTETITRSWGITMTREERWRTIDSVRATLGGVNVAQMRSSVSQPNELYVLSVSNLGDFLAEKLVEKQREKATASKPYLFEGLNSSAADKGCFADDAKEWCDAIDDVQIGALTTAAVDPSNLSKRWKKRLMHNIQDIGEFLLLAIDNDLPMGEGSTYPHAAAYLLEEVFLPKLKEAPLSTEQEALAWREVVYTVFVGGGYFFEIPSK